jgi:hypothetical protein
MMLTALEVLHELPALDDEGLLTCFGRKMEDFCLEFPTGLSVGLLSREAESEERRGVYVVTPQDPRHKCPQ